MLKPTNINLLRHLFFGWFLYFRLSVTKSKCSCRLLPTWDSEWPQCVSVKEHMHTLTLVAHWYCVHTPSRRGITLGHSEIMLLTLEWVWKGSWLCQHAFLSALFMLQWWIVELEILHFWDLYPGFSVSVSCNFVISRICQELGCLLIHTYFFSTSS